MSSTHLPFWLAAIYLPEIGPRTVLQLLETFADIEKLFAATPAELRAIGLSAQKIQALQTPNWRAVEKDLTWAQTADQHLISLDDPSYPKLLREIYDPPLVLYVRGAKTALAHLQLAIVGSRHATATGLQNAEQFAYSLAQAGLAVTSGLALGIDAAAHRGALAAGGTTIGVAGTGLHHTYPASHRALVADVIDKNGAIISEFPLNTPPKAANFPRRNRIISGLSIGVLVIEAALKSGSLITARAALQHGREVFAIPGSIHNPLARGCHHLLRQGAKLVETATDIVEELTPFLSALVPIQAPKLAPKCTPGHSHLEANLPAQSRELLAKIDYEITPMDVILLRSRLTAAEVSSILLSLELQGHIQSVSGGYARVVAN